MVVQVSVYRDGELVFTIMRDIQLAVIACSNAAPDASAGVITNLTGSATLSGPYSIELRETDSFCFDFTLSISISGRTSVSAARPFRCCRERP